ncbi:hypothetical protein QVD17_35233 [Tagetes erecta]|uniref:Leucine-rich repeat domain, L domain-containing protein n=1 Tax=Tagetes erecta TaxID=13708 RepID=A0AAD8NF05_TARER|nr:hypothetical protein QVD17_35233 [Tagetes erecta]
MHLLLSVFWWLYILLGLGKCSSFRETKDGFKTLAFSEMRNLRLLRLNYVQLSGSYKSFPRGLRWLCMHGFPLSYLPSDLQMENVVALDMSNSKQRRLWKKPRMLLSLKFLNLSSCHELVSVGNFSCLPSLEELVLTRCTSLEKVCESIGKYCQKLQILDLSECSEFPDEMKDMEALKYLWADNVNIKSHDSSSTTIVEAIPRGFKNFAVSLPRSLVELSLSNNNLSNESFPGDFSHLSMLKFLYLDENPIDSMPDCVRSLRRLELISFHGCCNLKTVDCAPRTLKHMSIYKCYLLEKVTFHQGDSSDQVNDVCASSVLPNEVIYRFAFAVKPKTMILSAVMKKYYG